MSYDYPKWYYETFAIVRAGRFHEAELGIVLGPDPRQKEYQFPSVLLFDLSRNKPISKVVEAFVPIGLDYVSKVQPIKINSGYVTDAGYTMLWKNHTVNPVKLMKPLRFK